MVPQNGHDEDTSNVDSLPDRIAAILTDLTIFITGGTGFIGKVFIEKILRKNFDIREIVLLIRTKKGMAPEDRLDSILNNPLYDTVVSLRGKKAIRKKFRVVTGDVSLPDLGLSAADRQYIISHVQVFIHTAASVRFDDPLKKAILHNTRGTKLVLDLARQCNDLKGMCHISTAYCHPEVELLEEKPYPPPADPHKVIAAAELLDEETLEIISRRLIPKYIPNTYVFSKALAEELVVQAMQEGMPVGVIRPSIVIPVFFDPLPGWTDNINGPTGLLIAAGKGVLRSMYGRGNCYADFIPVDVLASGIMIGIWDFATAKTVTLANFTSSSEVQVTWDELLDIGRKILNKIPLNGAVWYPDGGLTSSRLYHNFRVVFFHWLPAIIVDTILFLLRFEPVLIRVQRRLTKGRELFEFYTNSQWYFKSDFGQLVRMRLNARELKEYKVDTTDANIPKYLEECAMVARRYLLKQSDDTLPAARRHLRILYVVDRLCKTIFACLLMWLIFKSFSSYFCTSSTQIQEL
ncbi:putative fatty acyl-CoA reductase CG5065 [Hyposmocoma kahamanoa]|uniref:putative fatty acyl-CoA reductase CG5065 n=1 Tax=Hyposmocoma kahamanoa TaxID=1477025 RepID=UPI000E6D8048|nr:putative fatty acyl-CoA reductase CG5065 [Hyposmocoma kahamanoa]